MGGACICSNEIYESQVFWSGMNIRQMTFQEYLKIFEENKLDWITCSNSKNSAQLEIKNLSKLYPLLDSAELSEREREAYFNKLRNFIIKQNDKLIFFVCLAFFTSLREKQGKNNQAKLTQNEEEAQNFIKWKSQISPSKYDIVSQELMKMSIKKNDHHDVTRLFMQLVSEFTIDFLHIDDENKKEKFFDYSLENREELLFTLTNLPKETFYQYMFSDKNIKFITDDLKKISNQKKSAQHTNTDADYTSYGKRKGYYSSNTEPQKKMVVINNFFRKDENTGNNYENQHSKKNNIIKSEEGNRL